MFFHCDYFWAFHCLAIKILISQLREIVNNGNITSLIIESKTNLLEYKDNLADTLNGWNKWNICFNGIIIEKSSIKDS